MCNCGKNRASLAQPKTTTVQAKSSAPAEPLTVNTVFEYIGKTALTVIGTITGKRYRFNRPGDMQSVDHRDASGMSMVPVLKRRKE